MELGLGWLRAAVQGYNYSCNTKQLGRSFSIEFKQCFKTNELVPGWQRAVAQGYNYSYNTIELVINCQLNLKS